MKRIRPLIVFLMIISLSAGMLFLSSCSQPEKADYLIAYTNSTNDDVEYYSYNMPDKENSSTEDIVNELLSLLLLSDPEDGIHYSPLPQDVELNRFFLKDGVLTLDFNDAYNSLTNVQELILKACVVLTLVQVNDVESIVFTINGRPLTDHEGNEIGAMDPGLYVDILLSDEELLKQETSLNIYFTDDQGSSLKAYDYQFTLDDQTQSLEEYIVRKLIEGPDETDGGYPTIDPKTELISIMTTDKTCYVNFTGSFLEQNQTVSDDIMIYSIVNSLTDLAYINNVQILVNGESDVVLHKTFDLSNSLSRRYDLISE